MKTLAVALLFTFAPFTAYASGGLAPRQAEVDIQATCDGPSWSVSGLERGNPTVEEAVGQCFDFASGHGLTTVQWARYLASGRRITLRIGVDSTWVPVPETVPALVCGHLGGFELCR